MSALPCRACIIRHCGARDAPAAIAVSAKSREHCQLHNCTTAWPWCTYMQSVPTTCCLHRPLKASTHTRGGRRAKISCAELPLALVCRRGMGSEMPAMHAVSSSEQMSCAPAVLDSSWKPVKSQHPYSRRWPSTLRRHLHF